MLPRCSRSNGSWWRHSDGSGRPGKENAVCAQAKQVFVATTVPGCRAYIVSSPAAARVEIVRTLSAVRREQIIEQLRRPGPDADRLIDHYLAQAVGECRQQDCSYTSDVECALALLPDGVFFLCGRFEDGGHFWCDVGFRPKVQAWGESLASAIAGAIFAYCTHPERDLGGERAG